MSNVYWFVILISDKPNGTSKDSLLRRIYIKTLYFIFLLKPFIPTVCFLFRVLISNISSRPTNSDHLQGLFLSRKMFSNTFWYWYHCQTQTGKYEKTCHLLPRILLFICHLFQRPRVHVPELLETEIAWDTSNYIKTYVFYTFIKANHFHLFGFCRTFIILFVFEWYVRTLDCITYTRVSSSEIRHTSTRPHVHVPFHSIRDENSPWHF